MVKDMSTEALISILHIRGKLKRKVFAFLQQYENGATCDELERWLDMKHQTLSARVRELWQEGWIKKTGMSARTRSGRWAQVYAARKVRKKRSPRRRCDHCGQIIVKR